MIGLQMAVDGAAVGEVGRQLGAAVGDDLRAGVHVTHGTGAAEPGTEAVADRADAVGPTVAELVVVAEVPGVRHGGIGGEGGGRGGDGHGGEGKSARQNLSRHERILVV